MSGLSVIEELVHRFLVTDICLIELEVRLASMTDFRVFRLPAYVSLSMTMISVFRMRFFIS
jgi:hypothetical protein